MKKFIESVCVSEYEIGYMEINNSGYQFKMYRDCSNHYQSDAKYFHNISPFTRWLSILVP